MLNTVITGASRGIGLELTNWALSHEHKVMAVARNPDESLELKQLKDKWKDQLVIVKADLEERNFIETVLSSLNDWPHVDVLINNAGVLKRGESLEDFQHSFQVNTIAPFLMIKALIPKLKKAKKPKSVQISSLMGSIQDNTSGGDYTYRSSKAALNMLVKSLSIDEPWLVSTVLHPGWVQTRMGGTSAPTPVADSVKGLWKIIDALTPDDSGSFRDYRGNKLPW